MALHASFMHNPRVTVVGGNCKAVRAPSRLAALSGIPDAETPPYALLSTPVYSLVSTDTSGRTTMNMITYASPIALRPQRKYALGLYIQSLSYQNVKETGRGVLQILQHSHSGLVQLLGKTSGRDIDKVSELQRLGFQVRQEYGLPVLSDAVGLMELQVASEWVDAGDHQVIVCDVVNWKMLQLPSTTTTPLYTGYLREQGLL